MDARGYEAGYHLAGEPLVVLVLTRFRPRPVLFSVGVVLAAVVRVTDEATRRYLDRVDTKPPQRGVDPYDARRYHTPYQPF